MVATTLLVGANGLVDTVMMFVTIGSLALVMMIMLVQTITHDAGVPKVLRTIRKGLHNFRVGAFRRLTRLVEHKTLIIFIGLTEAMLVGMVFEALKEGVEMWEKAGHAKLPAIALIAFEALKPKEL